MCVCLCVCARLCVCDRRWHEGASVSLSLALSVSRPIPISRPFEGAETKKQLKKLKKELAPSMRGEGRSTALKQVRHTSSPAVVVKLS